jgi:hypothetical protein
LQYYLWGPGEKAWDVVIAVGPDLRRIAHFYSLKENMVVVENDLWPYRYYVAVYRLPQMNKEAIWPVLKEW